MSLPRIYDWKMQVYWRLPVFLQEFALWLYARQLERLYYGPGYEDWVQWFQAWRFLPLSDTQKWQSERLSCLIQHAARHVPYYREKWKGLNWRSIHAVSDLHFLPLLNKQEIRQNEQQFLTHGLDPNTLWVDKTSGTTGTALKIYWPKSTMPKFWALIEVMIRNVAGVAQDVPRAMMGGRPVVEGTTARPPYWRFNRCWNQLYLSSYHVSRETAPSYIAAIRKYGSRWITGYGSAIAALAESAVDAGMTPIKLRSAIVSGDTLLPGMRQSIERFFQCKCYDHYGQSEGVAMAMECAYGRMHMVPFVGILEILREDDTPCQPGEVGEIVATGLMNDAMPLIRYRIGDYAAWAKDQTCSCGNVQPIITNLEGRTDNYLITSEGRRIGRLSTAMKRSPTIHSAQIVQDRPGHAYLLIRPANGYRSADAAAVREDILERIGRFDLEVLEVSEIPKTPQGKTILVVRFEQRPEVKALYAKLSNVFV